MADLKKAWLSNTDKEKRAKEATEKTPKGKLAKAVAGAMTLDDLKQALLDYLQG